MHFYIPYKNLDTNNKASEENKLVEKYLKGLARK